jgi:predicted nuclease with TOPRIM domain
MKTTLFLSSTLVLAAACSGPRTNVTERDAYGNYVTTADYQSMDRASFTIAMREGLEDYERRLVDLRQRANELGGDALKEFSDYQEELDEKRVDFENEMERTEATLAENWPDQRERTLDAYYELRDHLDEAFEEVLE